MRSPRSASARDSALPRGHGWVGQQQHQILLAVLLQRMADPPAADLDEVVTRLDDPRQRDALLAMRRARWAGEGDPASARAALRTAFRDGPRWRPATAVDAALLPPLYPPR